MDMEAVLFQLRMQWQDANLLCSSTEGDMLNLSEIQSAWKQTPPVENRPMTLSGSVCPRDDQQCTVLIWWHMSSHFEIPSPNLALPGYTSILQ